MLPLILRVSQGGQPVEWIGWQDAALLYVKNQVIWTVGDEPFRVRGGMNRLDWKQSYLDIHPIVAVRGSPGHNLYRTVPTLSNRELFRRDKHTCLYCGIKYKDNVLTRDHVIPVSKGGQDVWTNVATACRSCNQGKGNRFLRDISMSLKAVPFTPNHAEWLILRNRNILADQMDFLMSQCPAKRQS